MAREATILRRYGNNGDVADITVSDSTAIPKGTFLTLADPETGAIATATFDCISGITAIAKEAGDGCTRLGVVTNCDAKVTASGAVVVGMPLQFSGTGLANYVGKATAGTATASGAQIIGYAKETAADGETFIARIRL
jgi:hypothetical protein